MVQLSSLLAVAFFASTGFCAAPEKSARDVLVDAYLDSWTPIKLIDVFPDALIDGLPANSSVIYSLRPPTNPSHSKREPTSHLLPVGKGPRLLAELNQETCYNNGPWVFQSQLQSGKTEFCGAASASNPQNGGTFHEVKYFWANGNSWAPFINSDGASTGVYFEITVHDGFLFSWNTCFDAFWTLISDCHGKNPDSSGGSLGYGNGQVDVRLQGGF